MTPNLFANVLLETGDKLCLRNYFVFISRMWEAERLASLGDDWIGRDIVRGITTACGGLVLLLQQS